MEDLFSLEAEEEETLPRMTTPTTASQATPMKHQTLGPTMEEEKYKNERLIKIETEGDVPSLYLLVTRNINSEHVYMQASDAHQTWVGVVTYRQIRETAKKSKGSEREYIDDTCTALTGGEGSFVYTTTLSPSDNGLEFSWKKHLVKDNIKVFLGSVVMETHSAPGIHAKMLEHAVGMVSNSRDVIRELKGERDRLTEERSGFIKRLTETVNMKDEVREEKERERGREGGKEGESEREGEEREREREREIKNNGFIVLLYGLKFYGNNFALSFYEFFCTTNYICNNI